MDSKNKSHLRKSNYRDKTIPAVTLPHNVTTAIRKFQEAVEEYSWSGSASPEDREKIELKYVRAKQKLRHVIKEYKDG